MSNETDAIFSGLNAVGKKWKKAKRQSDKEDRLSRKQIKYTYWKPEKHYMNDVCNANMEKVYNQVSSNGKYYANARQLMYKMRPIVLQECGRIWKNDTYFTQTIIKDYLQSHNPNWKVIWDARGHFKEPHTDLTIGIGGLEVSQYCDGWTGDNVISTNSKFGFKKMIDTIGPKNRFGAVLFIEKEGFNELLDDCNIGDEYDIAIMSTKGSPVGASCVLANKLSSYGIKIFVLHDFDFAGFKIINTLRNGTRLSPSTPDVIDMGLRLDDMDDTMVKDAEPCLHKQRKDPKIMLREYDATEEECDFLVGTQYSRYWDGKRVELNAMTSEQFINHIKKKLKKHGVKKVIPEEKVLRKGYQRAVYYQRIFKEIDRIKDDLKKDIVIPEKLNEKVEDKIKKKETWENVLWNIAEKDEK